MHSNRAAPALTLMVTILVVSAAASVGANTVVLPCSWLTISILLAIFFVSLALIAFYAGSETAIVSANKEKVASLAGNGNVQAKIIQGFLQSPDTMLAVVLVGTNLMTTIAGQSGIILAGFAFPGRENIQKLLNTVVLTVVILIFCEIVPKVIYRIRADKLALSSAGGLRLTAFILAPVVFVVTRVTGLFLPKTDLTNSKTGNITAIREELLLLATMGEKEASIPREQLQMMHNVLNLESRPVKRVMVPLIDIVAIAHTATLDELFEKVNSTGFTRIIVYQDRIDNLVGYVNILEVIRSSEKPPIIAPFIRREVSFEPESKHVITLLRQLYKTGRKISFILDEYGGITGMVAREDLVEEILGELREDNIKDVSQHIHKISSGVYECDGSVEIKELLNRNIKVPTGDYETIAGYVESALQKIPQPGEVVTVGNVRIFIVESNYKKISKVRISIKEHAKK